MIEQIVGGVKVTVKGKSLNYMLPKGFSGQAFKEWKTINKPQLDSLRGVETVIVEGEPDELRENVLALTDAILN